MVEHKHSELEFLMTSFLYRIERRLISLEKRVISLECRSPDNSPWHINYRPVQDEAMMMLPEDSPDYDIIPKPRVRTFSKKKKKISMYHPVCMQCCKRFIVQDNSPCSCIYHYGELKFVREGKFILTCCQVRVFSRSMVWSVPGCTKGWHCVQHHTNHPYTHYYIHMSNMSLEAQEVWLAVDILDPITQSCEWAEVGLSAEGRLYVIVGYAREQPLAYKEFSVAELKECKSQNSEIIRRSSDEGWTLHVSLQSAKSVAKSLTVSLRAASYKSSLTKRLQLVITGRTVRPGSTDTLSDPTPPVAKGQYTLCESVCNGPVLRPGPDYSLNRKNDYTTLHTSQGMRPILLTQMESVSVNSSHIRQANDKWNNLFTVSLVVSNESATHILITDIYMEYLTKVGVWKKCDQHWIAMNGGRQFIPQCCCPVASGVDVVLSLRAAIAVSGAMAECGEKRQRAHFSLPQPLHLRAVCCSSSGSASLRLEQGNPPLQLLTREEREREWNVALPFYCFADCAESLRRTDVALFYNDDGMLVMRACVYGANCEDTMLRTAALMSAAHYAKKHRKAEHELMGLRRVSYESSVQVFAVVDLQLGVPYALKVDINTPTSHCTAYHSLPRDDYSTSFLKLTPSIVVVNGNMLVSWSLPRASINDTIRVFAEHGNYRLSEVANGEGVCNGSEQLRAPSTPGVYSVRYYPAWLAPENSSTQHHSHILATSLTVITDHN